jgi:MFS superfamily sulfate permease-like transporter
VWWPPAPGRELEQQDGVAVLGFAAPLTFLNSEAFERGFFSALAGCSAAARLVILEAAGLVALDYTGAEAFKAVVAACRQRGHVFAVARLESLAAQAAFDKFGLRGLVGQDHMFDSVAAALRALGPKPDPALDRGL